MFDRPLARQVAVLPVLSRPSAWVSPCGRAAVGGPWQTQLFVALTVGQLALALALRPAGSWRRSAGRAGGWVPVAVAVSGCCSSRGCTCRCLSELLGTEALSPAELAVPAVAALVPAAAVLLRRRLPRR